MKWNEKEEAKKSRRKILNICTLNFISRVMNVDFIFLVIKKIWTRGVQATVKLHFIKYKNYKDWVKYFTKKLMKH